MLVISGGQSGADIGGVVGAFSAGHSCLFIAFRGFKPQGRDSLPSVIPYKDAVMPEWAVSYPQMLLARTQHNVELADATVVFINTMHLKDSIGSRRTMEYAQKMQRPRLLLTLFGQSDVEPTAGGSSRTLAWPSWLAVGAALPTSLASGKSLVVSVTCTDTTDAAAIAASAVQP
jgi:hypothetical protein